MDESTEVKTLREMLDTIDGWLLGEHGVELATVLSAVRGPDQDTGLYVKRHTTGPVRSAAFPRMAAHHGRGLWVTGGIFRPVQPDEIDMVGPHFAQHVHQAANVLGLNPKKDEMKRAFQASKLGSPLL